MKRKKFKATFEQYGEFVAVTAYWNPGFPGSREEPPEPAGWEIESISLSDADGRMGDNFLNFASDECIARAEDALDESLSLYEDEQNA
jgi:hypothetical protein